MLPDFFLFSFPCSADHERDWSPCKVVFFGLAANKYAECEKQVYYFTQAPILICLDGTIIDSSTILVTTGMYYCRDVGV